MTNLGIDFCFFVSYNSISLRAEKGQKEMDQFDRELLDLIIAYQNDEEFLRKLEVILADLERREASQAQQPSFLREHR